MQTGDKNIIFEMKSLDRLLRKTIEQEFRALDDDDQITRMHHWIIGFLFDRQDKDIFQRDVEAEFRISRSTTSSMLTLMEKKGLVIRQSVPGDARLKKLTLTEKAKQLHSQHMHAIHEFDSAINSSITPEEKQELLRIISKLSAAANKLAAKHDNSENKQEVDS
ncbi:MAG: MarR family transcriptional regulator [Clostridia bacterium]|nr:MarR family transcriptional regulator [Clostridia bacterium]